MAQGNRILKAWQLQRNSQRLTAAGPALVKSRLLGQIILTAALMVSPCVVTYGDEPLPSVPVYIEDSLAATELMADARKLRSEDRLAQAVIKFQLIVDTYMSKLMPIAPGRYADAARCVQQEIAGDAKLLDAYRRYQQPPAARALEEALRGGAVGGDIHALELVVRRFTLTRAGVDAGLRLAALYLEQAAAVDATTVLDALVDHPDMPDVATRWHTLQATAALLDGRASDIAQHQQWLTDHNETKAAASLTALRESLALPARRMTQDGFDPSAIDDWPRPQPQPIWQVLTQSAREGADDTRQPGGLLEESKRVAAEGVSHFIVPMVDGDRLYVNDGISVAALDRSSGRMLWSFAREGDPMPQMPMNRGMGMARPLPDQRGVASSGALVCAVVGRASQFTRNWGQNMFQTWLVGLQRGSGDVLWQVTPGEVDETLERAFFHGTPIIDQGRVYAMVRRSQMSGFHGAFVVAVEARTGKTLWRRHLSSAAPNGSGSEISMTQMRLHRGRLFLADNLGSVSCIDGRTGSVQWMTIAQDLPAPQRQAIIHLQRARGVPMVINNRPIITEAGLVIPSVAGTSTAWVVNPTTGAIERELEDEAWAAATYVMELPSESGLAEGIITVGESVRCYDGKTLELRWQDSLEQRSRLRPRGRPAVTKKHVVLPMTDHLVVLDLETGASVDEPRIDAPGNLLLLDDQLIIAGSQAVFGYMQWPRAYELLAAQMQANPLDTKPGMAMAHLAKNTQHWDVLLEGVDAALAAVAAVRQQTVDGPEHDVIADEVFEQIRAMVDKQSEYASGVLRRSAKDEAEMPIALRQALFDRLADAAMTPAHVVSYRLALGRDLELRGSTAEAVDQYQAILMDPALAAEHVNLAGGSHQASLEATQRLRELVHSDPLVYAQYQAMAADRLAVLTVTREAGAARLVALAERFPLSTTAATARAQAAELLAHQKRFSEAIVQLHRAYAQAESEPLLAQIVGRLVTLYEMQGQPTRARQWLNRAVREHPTLMPIRDGVAAPLDQWLALLSKHTGPHQTLPAYEPPIGEPAVVEGQLLLPRHQPVETLPHDLMMLRLEKTVVLRGGPTLAVKWTMPLVQEDIELISMTGDQALFWLAETSTLLAVDVRTGAAAWRYDHVSALIEQITGEALTMQQRRFRNALSGPLTVRNQRIVRTVPDTPEGYLVVANEMVVCVTDRGGRAMAMDRHSGQILWRKRCRMEQINLLAIDDDALAIAGTSTLPLDAQDGHVALLDPFTGEPKLPQRDEREAIVWMNFPGGGSFQYATAKSVTMIDLNDGRSFAKVNRDGKAFTDVAVANSAFGVFHDEGGAAVIVDFEKQAIAASIELPNTNGRTAPVRLRRGGDLWFLGSPWHASAWSRDGQVVWRDAVGATRTAMTDMLIAQDHVAVVAQVDAGSWLAEQERRDGRWDAPALRHVDGAFRLYLLDRSSGAIAAVRNLPPTIAPPVAWEGLMLKHHVIIPAGGQTIIMPDHAAIPQ